MPVLLDRSRPARSPLAPVPRSKANLAISLTAASVNINARKPWTPARAIHNSRVSTTKRKARDVGATSEPAEVDCNQLVSEQLKQGHMSIGGLLGLGRGASGPHPSPASWLATVTNTGCRDQARVG
jgi:hypothetical protein